MASAMGEALEHDRFGRVLPDWQGCRVLGPGEVFLMNTVRRRTPSTAGISDHCRLTTIVGRADPIWTREEN